VQAKLEVYPELVEGACPELVEGLRDRPAGMRALRKGFGARKDSAA